MEKTDLIELQVKPPPQGKITFEEFLAWVMTTSITLSSRIPRAFTGVSAWLDFG
jgi:hypothetical protein